MGGNDGRPAMRNDLESMIRKFVSGEDTSIAHANKIEVEIDTAYPNDAYMEETVIVLAHYRPGGGEFLCDTAYVQKKLVATLKYMASSDREPT